MAGKRKGKEDERHLWPEMLRAIREIKPKYIVGENVFGLLNWNGGMVFDEVHSDLEFEGYEVQAVVIPAAAVNAPHGRDRVWFVATNTIRISNRGESKQSSASCKQGRSGETNSGIGSSREQQSLRNITSEGDATDTTSTERAEDNGKRKSRFNDQKSTPNDWNNFPTQSPICGGDDGIPTELDGITFSKWRNESIKAYGNAIVPQVAYEIFKAIQRTI